MAETTKRYGRPGPATPVTPINFRMPTPLRSRLRKFAEDRNVGEADALRLIVSEHLDEADRDREQSEAERWQLAEVYGTLRRRKRAPRPSVSRHEIDLIFAGALEAARQRQTR